MNETLIGDIILSHRDGRLYGADIRIYCWLEQWLSEAEARQFVSSLKLQRLFQLVVTYRHVIATVSIWPKERT